MKLKFVGHRRRDVVPATGAREFPASPGDVIDVDDATAQSLLEQPRWFQPVKESGRKPDASDRPDKTDKNKGESSDNA